MDHPFVKKLLRNELLMWGLGVLVVVALPMGVVVLEATTSSSSAKQSTKGRTTSKTKNRSAASKLKVTSEAIAETSVYDDTSDDITDGILDPAAVFGRRQSLDRNGLANASSVSSEAEATSVLSEVSSDTVGSDILYFGGGGGLTDSSSEGLVEVGIVDIAVGDRAIASNEDNSLLTGVTDVNEPASVDTVNTAGLSILTGDSEEADPKLIALMAAGDGVPVKQGSEPQDQAELTGSSSEVEEKEDTRKRTEVTLIRPKGAVVKSIDEVIFRCRTHSKLFPYVLVRSRQKSAPWWVQNDTLRQGTYVRGRAQFGNRVTIDGSRFSLLVAFVENIEDVPEPGTRMADVPEGVLVSQELEFTLRK
jgi:hypothetical protein